MRDMCYHIQCARLFYNGKRALTLCKPDGVWRELCEGGTFDTSEVLSQMEMVWGYHLHIMT